MVMEALRPDGSQVFRASWRSGVVWTALVTALLAAGLGWAGWGMGLNSKGSLLGLLALFFIGIAWLVMRPLFSAVPVLSVGPQGVGGFLLQGHTVPWGEISDVQHATVQGHPIVTLVLHPGTPSLARTRSLLRLGRHRNISLGPLRKAEREPALAAVMQAFRRYAGPQVQAAARALMDAAVSETEFHERLHARTPSTWALYAVMAVNVGVWLLNLLNGLSAMQPSSAELFAWGANSTTAVVRDGEWWRLFSATVLHAGVMHLALNMYALWDAGRQVCRWFGNGQFLLIYLGSALAGSALSLHFSAQQAVSVGASGAVFGVLGALMAGVYQHRERVPKAMVTRLLTSQGLFVVFMLAQGFTRSGIDNAAHIGGLVAGMVIAWLLVELVDERASLTQRFGHQVLAVSVTALGVGGLVWSAQPGVDHRELFGNQAMLREVLPPLQAAEKALQQDAQARKEGRLPHERFLDALEQRHIPAVRGVVQTMDRVRPVQALPLLDDLRNRNVYLLEMMELELGMARGTVDPAQARPRLAELSALLTAVDQRLKDRSAKTPD
jgi:rhomboid protease GluP